LLLLTHRLRPNANLRQTAESRRETMATTGRRLGTWLTGLLMAATAVAGLTPAAHAATKTIYCFPAHLDSDGDGYAKPTIGIMAVTPRGVINRVVNTQPVPIVVDETQSMNCPAGYVNYNTDCNDGDPNVHPRRGEIAFNGVDDNCNGFTDESEYFYSTLGNGNTHTSFNITAGVNDAQIIAAAANLLRRGDLSGPELDHQRDVAENSCHRRERGAPLHDHHGERAESLHGVPRGGAFLHAGLLGCVGDGGAQLGQSEPSVLVLHDDGGDPRQVPAARVRRAGGRRQDEDRPQGLL
jgi:hypothetical protein